MVDILCDFEGNPIYATPREHLAVRSGEYEACIVHNEQMERECLQLIHDYKPCEPITVQLIRQKGTDIDYYIEINPRFGGEVPFVIHVSECVVRFVIRKTGGVPTGCCTGRSRV